MLKIMIVDDEEIERMSMHKILSESFSEIEIAEAKNGQMAIELSDRFMPDLILMDIKMPGMNGLDAIKVISKESSTKCIMVTAYDTFEFAREAIKLGVKDYLLKPSKISDIVMTVGNVIKEIEADKGFKALEQKHEIQFEYSKRVLETDLVTQLLFDQVHEVHVETLMDILGIKTVNEMFVMVVLIPDEMEHLYIQWVKQLKGVGNVWIGPLYGRYFPVIVFRSKGTSYRSQVTEIVNTGLKVNGKPTDKGWYVGIGTAYDSLNKMKKSYQEALIAMMAITRPGTFRFFKDINTGSNYADNLLIKYKREEFSDHVRLGEWSNIKNQLILLTKCYEQENIPLEHTKQRIMEMIWMIYHILNEMGIDIQSEHYFLKERSYQQFTVEIGLYIEKISQKYKETYSDSELDSIQQVKQYIKKHSSESISLEMLGDRVGLSPIYISKLFKEKLEINYIDYLTLCRIDNAKEKMLILDKSIKEISMEVGYHDPNYFSKVFKKHMGVSPKSYRDKILGASILSTN